MRSHNWIVLIGLLVMMVTCVDPDRKVEFTPNASIMVMSDVHYEDSSSALTNRLRTMINQLNDGEYDVDMLVVTGDNVDDVYGGSFSRGTVDTSDNRLTGLLAIYADLQIPFHLAIGNHDLKIASGRDYDDPWTQSELIEMTAVWQTYTGFEPYYGVTHEGWRLVFMNSMEGHYKGAHFDPDQIAFLKTELERGLPTILFSHLPLRTDHVRSWSKRESDLAGPYNSRELYRLLWTYQDQVKAIFVGHGHLFMDDLLYDKIQVIETDGFEDGDSLSFNILELNTLHQRIRVSKGSDIMRSEQKKESRN